MKCKKFLKQTINSTVVVLHKQCKRHWSPEQ